MLWYQALNKSKLNPPQWVFPVVWTILYILMAVSLFVYLKSVDFQFNFAVFIFCVQLVLNLIWTPLFFIFRRVRLALIDIVILWVLILFTIILFSRNSSLAAWLLVPYLIWVTLATYLNFYIVRNNPNQS